MNIRDYLFIRKAKSSNKIKILDVLGFEADTTIIQTPDIIKSGDRIAQLVLVNTHIVDFKVVDSLPETDRSSGGFGSTD